ncbi:FAD/NAD(P)-binding protein [Rhizobium sp. BK376]|uniref:FAD/NAD(P)-binding protein n=1 Tax=Rhizobium sp. BK376 TaxID=2512149 RepID=UPI00104F33A5|nr:FAD/NAD(P)-binding protein [Rhizobium sp. BK376]TCR83646.1 putative NAD(P)/FAD-binding protein YdhS [Rhizobium sp. BK376]
MDTQAHGKPIVVIIGGGVSGAGVAYYLAQSGLVAPGHLIVFEPRRKLGAGLAYDTPDPAHRINVPSIKMSLLPDDPEHFQRWVDASDAIAGDEDARSFLGHLFPRRAVFGDYVNAMVQPLIDSGAITHLARKVSDVRRRNNRWLVSDEEGRRVEADILVLATSHPSPTPPASLTRALGHHPRFVADPTRPDALDVIGAGDRVLVVGNGLTSADVIASLDLRGHRGAITAISRRGLRSRGHARTPQDPYGDFTTAPARTALELLKKVRHTIREAEAGGASWHGVIDQVRGQGHVLWRALPVSERRRIVRHLRPYWDVHRFRIAPQVEEVGDRAIAAGRLEILAASIESVRVDGEKIDCVLRVSRSQNRIERLFDAVVVTTGPGHRAIFESQGWIARLAEAGYLALEPTGLGLDCTMTSQALGPTGEIAPSFYISGPLARGTFGELMGLPQVAEHAVFVAGQVAKEIELMGDLTRLDNSAA